MKIILICFLIVLNIDANSFDMKDITKKIEDIEVSDNTYDKINYEIYDPFAVAKPIMKKNGVQKRTVVSIPYIRLQTVLNARVFMNNSWYDVGDKIQGYKVKSIHKNFVVLAQKSVLKIIKIDKTQDSKMIIKTKEPN